MVLWKSDDEMTAVTLGAWKSQNEEMAAITPLDSKNARCYSHPLYIGQLLLTTC